MATLFQIRDRLRSVNNIRKITKAMKMVSAAKLRGVENHLNVVRVFQRGVTNAWPQPTAMVPPYSPPTTIKKGDKDVDPPPPPPKDKVVEPPTQANLLVLVTADRGLCGGFNSAIVRASKLVIAEELKNRVPVYLAMVGEKARQQMDRVYNRYFIFSSTELYKSKVFGFRQATRIAESLMALTPVGGGGGAAAGAGGGGGSAGGAPTEFDRIDFMYNRYKNAMSFETRQERIFSMNLLQKQGINAFSSFELENGEGYRDMLRNLFEFRMAVRVYHIMQESIAAETASRMNAMSNSSKSSDQMSDQLRLLYNRTRQAKITTELVEVISGALAMKNLAE